MGIVNVKLESNSTVEYRYVLFVPNGTWVFNDLSPGAVPYLKQSTQYYPYNEVVMPIDLITAARLRLIKPGDDSGVSDEQWAWLKLLGLTGESK